MPYYRKIWELFTIYRNIYIFVSIYIYNIIHIHTHSHSANKCIHPGRTETCGSPSNSFNVKSFPLHKSSDCPFRRRVYIIGIYIYCNRYNARSRSCYFGFFSQQYINVYRFFTNRPSRNRKTIATKLSRIRTWFFWLGFFLLTTAFCR